MTKTRFPLAVTFLRCQWDDLSSREGRQWVDMVAGLIARGEGACTRPAIDAMQGRLWLFAGDPA